VIYVCKMSGKRGNPYKTSAHRTQIETHVKTLPAARLVRGHSRASSQLNGLRLEAATHRDNLKRAESGMSMYNQVGPDDISGATMFSHYQDKAGDAKAKLYHTTNKRLKMHSYMDAVEHEIQNRMLEGFPGHIVYKGSHHVDIPEESDTEREDPDAEVARREEKAERLLKEMRERHEPAKPDKPIKTALDAALDELGVP